MLRGKQPIDMLFRCVAHRRVPLTSFHHVPRDEWDADSAAAIRNLFMTYRDIRDDMDRRTVFQKGTAIFSGIKARRKLTFLRVTTAAGGVKPGAYWGYSVLSADSEGNLVSKPYHSGFRLQSVPA